MNIIEAWELGLTGKGVTIVNVDSGLEYAHDDLIFAYDSTISIDLVDNDR